MDHCPESQVIDAMVLKVNELYRKNDASSEEALKEMSKIKSLRKLPVSEWELKYQLQREEIMSAPDPYLKEMKVEIAETISDYTPNVMFIPQKYSDDYYQFKKLYHCGPFQTPDPLAFHLTAKMLQEHDECTVAIFESDGLKRECSMAAKSFLSGEKSFCEALQWLNGEFHKSHARYRRGYMKDVTYIGCPLVPQKWAINRAKALREKGEVPEQLMISYFPSFLDKLDASAIVSPNERLIEAIRELELDSSGMVLPSDALTCYPYIDLDTGCSYVPPVNPSVIPHEQDRFSYERNQLLRENQQLLHENQQLLHENQQLLHEQQLIHEQTRVPSHGGRADRYYRGFPGASMDPPMTFGSEASFSDRFQFPTHYPPMPPSPQYPSTPESIPRSSVCPPAPFKQRSYPMPKSSRPNLRRDLFPRSCEKMRNNTG